MNKAKKWAAILTAWLLALGMLSACAGGKSGGGGGTEGGASPGGSTTSFTATSRRNSRSEARQTVPMPPVPIAARSAYRPPMTVPGAALPLGVVLHVGVWEVTAYRRE